RGRPRTSGAPGSAHAAASAGRPRPTSGWPARRTCPVLPDRNWWRWKLRSYRFPLAAAGRRPGARSGADGTDAVAPLARIGGDRGNVHVDQLTLDQLGLAGNPHIA